jgi:hypothetical protein
MVHVLSTARRPDFQVLFLLFFSGFLFCPKWCSTQ